MDKVYIKGLIQNVLNKEFTSNERRRINDFNTRLNFCCPFCGDGKSDHKKRGNFYYNKFVFICFNCDKKTTIDKFCKDFNEVIDPEKKLEMINHLDSITTYSDYESDFVDAKFENLINLSDLEVLFQSHETPISDFKPIQVNGGVYKYLIGRGISPDMMKNIYQAKYWMNEEVSEWIIVMLNRKGDKVLGIQIRNLKEGKRRLFKIYNYESLITWLHGENHGIDINEMVVYNKLSYYFNIMNVNLEKKITVFEGYLDSLFFPNSIGLVGVNTDYKMIEGNGLDIQYFFDNDEAGHKKSDQKIKEGYSVFLWNKLFEDIVNQKKSNDPFRLHHRISKVKDINKLCQLVPDGFNKLNLINYFSKDMLDLRWIPKYGKKRKQVDVIDYRKKMDSL